jgi:polyisoprenoid-binding protein YceI
MVMGIAAGCAGPVAADTGEVQQYAVDRGASTVGFTVSAKALFTVKRDGVFRDFAGKVVYDPANPDATQVDITVFTASVDLKSADQEDLLRSEEFFDTGNHPTMRFISTAVHRRADGLLDVAGDLTIRGVTRHLVVPMTIVQKIGASASAAFDTRFQIDRTEFGLTGSGPKAKAFRVSIGRMVDIHLAIAAARTALGARQ